MTAPFLSADQSAGVPQGNNLDSVTPRKENRSRGQKDQSAFFFFGHANVMAARPENF